MSQVRRPGSIVKMMIVAGGLVAAAPVGFAGAARAACATASSPNVGWAAKRVKPTSKAINGDGARARRPAGLLCNGKPAGADAGLLCDGRSAGSKPGLVCDAQPAESGAGLVCNGRSAKAGLVCDAQPTAASVKGVAKPAAAAVSQSGGH